MGCNDLLLAVAELGKSTLVLMGATLYRIIMFMVYLSASIGPSVLISHVYEYCTGFEPVPDVVESAICMLFVSCWAEFSVGAEKRLFGNVLAKYKERYPNTMSFGRFTVHFALYVTAFGQLYAQFQDSHSIPGAASHKSSRKNNPFRDNKNQQNVFVEVISTDGSLTDASLSDNEREAEAQKNQGNHTALFLLALAYLVFVTSKNLHKDMLHVVRNLPYPSFSAFNNCMIRLGFAIIHLVMNGLYFIPCIAMAYSIRSYKYTGNLTYFQLNFAAGLCGMIAALFEMNKPWPQQRGQMPFLYLENNLIGKNILAHVLVLFILIAYYRPFNHKKTPEKHFDSSNNDVMYFCLSVAFTLLHILKYGTHAVLSVVNEFDTTHIQEAPDLPPEILGNSSSATGGLQNEDDTNRSESTVCTNCRNRSDNDDATRANPNDNNNGLNSQNGNRTIARLEETRNEATLILASKLELLKALKSLERAVLIQSAYVNQQGPGESDQTQSTMMSEFVNITEVTAATNCHNEERDIPGVIISDENNNNLNDCQDQADKTYLSTFPGHVGHSSYTAEL